MKKYITSLAGILWIVLSAAADPDGINSEEWKLYTSENGVEIYMKKQACDDPANGIYMEYVLIRVANTNDQAVEVSWISHPYHDNEPAFDDNPDEELAFTVAVRAGSSVEGSCGERGLSEYKRFTRKSDIRELTDLELANLTVTLK